MNTIEAKNRIAMLASITGRHDLTDELGSFLTQQQAIIDQQASQIHLHGRLTQAREAYIAELEKTSLRYWYNRFFRKV